jgi:hypothetical protein
VRVKRSGAITGPPQEKVRNSWVTILRSSYDLTLQFISVPMKKLQPFLCLLPVLLCLITARAEDPTTTTAPATPAPEATDASAQAVDPAKAVEIRKLLELTGTAKMTHQVVAQMINSFKSQNSDVSSEFWDRFEKEMNVEDLVNKMVPLYAKYYTLDDLKAVNAFYQTPAGQRVLAATPQIMRESMQIGQDWGRGVASRLLAELKAEKAKGSAGTPAPAPAAH